MKYNIWRRFQELEAKCEELRQRSERIEKVLTKLPLVKDTVDAARIKLNNMDDELDMIIAGLQKIWDKLNE